MCSVISLPIQNATDSWKCVGTLVVAQKQIQIHFFFPRPPSKFQSLNWTAELIRGVKRFFLLFYLAFFSVAQYSMKKKPRVEWVHAVLSVSVEPENINLVRFHTIANFFPFTCFPPPILSGFGSGNHFGLSRIAFAMGNVNLNRLPRHVTYLYSVLCMGNLISC